MTEEKRMIDDFGISKVLGDWAPKCVEATPMAQLALSTSKELDTAARDAVVLLMNELMNQSEYNGKVFRATLTQKRGDINVYWIVLLVTNGDLAVPKGRCFVTSPEELKESSFLWSILGPSEQAVIDSMIGAGKQRREQEGN